GHVRGTPGAAGGDPPGRAGPDRGTARHARRARPQDQFLRHGGNHSMTDATIPTVRLGEGGPGGGVQGLGCMGMSFAYGPTDADASRAALERALELGVTLYDTADAYGDGQNETFLSPFFTAHRDEVVIATKFALAIPPEDPTRRIIRNDAP